MKSSDPKKRIIGITGAFGSGKTTAALFFKKRGYSVLTLSAILENEAKKRKLPLTRKVFQDLGNEMRASDGPGILMQKAIVDNNDNLLVIDGLRNIGEIEALKKHKNGILLAIVADKKIRFNRLKNLKRREKLSWYLFNQLDLRDLGVNEKITGLQTALCIALADAFIDSNGTLNEFECELDKFLIKYEK